MAISCEMARCQETTWVVGSAETFVPTRALAFKTKASIVSRDGILPGGR